MAYLFKQKLQINELSGLSQPNFRVLVYEPDETLGGLYAHYLSLHNFDIKGCPDLAGLKDYINNFQPQILVFSADSAAAFASAKTIFSYYPGLKVVTTGYNLNSEGVSQLMSLGVLSHLNRRFTRPADLPALLKTLL
jgi:hypothetical protein